MIEAAFELNQPLKDEFPCGFRIDELINNQMQSHWKLVLPGWHKEAKSSRTHHVVYVDDKPETRVLPRSVKVVNLPLEVIGGFTCRESQV